MMKRSLTVQQFELELQRYFRQQKAADLNFSIKSFALKAGAIPSTLQKVARGERRLGLRLAKELASKMNVEIEHDSSLKKKAHSRKGWKLTLDSNSAVHVSWLNLAILESIKLERFQPNVLWLAAELGVPGDAVEKAVEDMKQKGMLTVDDNRWKDSIHDASSGSSGYRSTFEIRRAQTAVLELSKSRVESEPFEVRDHGFSVLPISKSDLAKLKKRIQLFRWELCELAQKSRKSKDAVYVLHTGFFSLSRK